VLVHQKAFTFAEQLAQSGIRCFKIEGTPPLYQHRINAAGRDKDPPDDGQTAVVIWTCRL